MGLAYDTAGDSVSVAGLTAYLWLEFVSNPDDITHSTNDTLCWLCCCCMRVSVVNFMIFC